jgi:hypothetical protein
MSACTAKTEHIVANPYKMAKSCESIDQSLEKLDRYILVVENSSAFHLEEASVAYEIPGVTISNHKKHMLRDAKSYREELISKHRAMECPTTKTK